MKRFNVIIEARMGSTRLPGKTMMPILGKPVLGLLLERLSYSRRIDEIIVATTTKSEDGIIADYCLKQKISCFRGSSEDVLGRVWAAARKYRTDCVVEVTADCPLLDPWLIDECIEVFKNGDYDYLSNFITQSYPAGIDVQIFTYAALEKMNRLAKDEKFREHVTLYILKHQNDYKVINVTAPPDLFFPDWHLELDEPKDYELIKLIYERLYPQNPRFTSKEVVSLLKENPVWLKINRGVQRRWEAARKERGI